MRRLLLVAILAGCAGQAPEPVEPASTEPEAAPADVVDAVEGAVEQYRQAYEVRALEGLEPLYVRSEELVLIAEGRRFRGWVAARGYLEELLGEAREVRMKLGQISVVALGEKSALATVEVEREIGDGTTSVKEEGLLTLVFLYRAGLRGAERWRIVGEHFSRAPQDL